MGKIKRVKGESRKLFRLATVGSGSGGWGGRPRLGLGGGASMQNWGTSSLTDCSTMLSQFIAVIPYSFWHFQLCLSHMAGFFFFFRSTPTSSPSFAPPPFPPSLVQPASFLFSALLFLHLCSISSLSGCTLIALCVWNGRGQVAQGSYYFRAHVADGVSRGQPGWTEERRGVAGSQEEAVRCVKDATFDSRGEAGGRPRGWSGQKWVVLFFLDGYILSTCRPPENNSGGDLCLAEVSALLLCHMFGFWGNMMNISYMNWHLH